MEQLQPLTKYACINLYTTKNREDLYLMNQFYTLKNIASITQVIIYENYHMSLVPSKQFIS